VEEEGGVDALSGLRDGESLEVCVLADSVVCYFPARIKTCISFYGSVIGLSFSMTFT
jgi:hypothetical protein